jgi:hypothetical protein
MENLDLEPNLNTDSTKPCSNPDPDSVKREHPALQKMKYINCFLLFWVIFVLLDPVPIRIRIHNTALKRYPCYFQRCLLRCHPGCPQG